MEFGLAMFVKPFFFLVVTLFVAGVSTLLHKIIPEGKIKRILYTEWPRKRVNRDR